MRSRIVVLLAAMASLALDAQPLGSDFKITPGTQQDDYPASVACDAKGDFVVVWRGVSGTGQVFGQRFGPTALPLDVAFRINTDTTLLSPNGANVAMNASGKFVAVWEGADAEFSGVFGQLFDASGARIGGNFQVNTFTTGQQAYPATAMDGSGNFVVVWQSYQGGASNYHIVGRRYDSSGSPLGGEISISASGSTDQRLPSVASDPNGNFVVVWWDETAVPGGAKDVFGQRFSASGQKSGGEFRVNTYTTDSQFYPAVAMDSSGGFVVAWYSTNLSFEGGGVRARRYSASGAPLGSDASAIITSTFQKGVGLAVDPFGNFVVVGSDMPTGNKDIRSTRIKANGQSNATYRVNTYTTGDQIAPRVAMTNDRYVIVWNNQDDGVIWARLLNAGPQGDASGDGSVDVADVFYLINYLFAGGPVPLGAADANFDGTIDITDVFYLINYLFAGGPAPV